MLLRHLTKAKTTMLFALVVVMNAMRIAWKRREVTADVKK
jgi:hypothetical protein